MEVHHHSHTSRKKWTHYIWEFLMLFLAVFCGFLAENQREHMIEHRREKQFMSSLLSDLIADTTEIRASAKKATQTLLYQDSVFLYLDNYKQTDYVSAHFIDSLSLLALRRLAVVFNDVTAMQLKNAGNWRLIRKENVSRKIALYWNEQENVRISLGRYLIYRDRGRELEEKLFAFYEFDVAGARHLEVPSKIRIIQTTPVLWAEYLNVISHSHVTAEQYLMKLNNQLEMAMELIGLLKKEYHL